MLQVLYSFFVFVEYVEVILIESYVYFLIPEVPETVRSLAMNNASMPSRLSTIRAPFSVPNANTAVESASPVMELSEKIVTDASSFCTGQPVSEESR